MNRKRFQADSLTLQPSWLFLKQVSLGASLLALSWLFTALPAEAQRLQQWRFDGRQNQLEFTTDAGVQPRAQLITSPTRLVIDLPGIAFGRKQQIEPVSNSPGIQSFRVGQFDRQTTRIVLELAPGYTIDPMQVQFEGLSPRQWRVKIPRPYLGQPIEMPPAAPPSNLPGSTTARTQILGVRVTGDGLFLKTSGTQPQPQVTRSRDRRQVQIDFPGTSISPSASPRDLVVNQKGVSRAFLTQVQGIPPIARLTLSVDPNAPDWQASYSNLGGGVIVIPALPDSPGTRPREEDREPQVNQRLATIQGVELEGDRLVIRANQPISYTSTWDRATGAFRIILPAAQLDRNVRGPRLTANSPLLQVKLRQDNPQTASVLVTPASGTQVGELNQVTAQSVVLTLRRAGSSFPPPTTPGAVIPVPPPSRLPGPTPLPRIPAGRQVVVIDPGHGGPDPGAVGIGNIFEKEIVLDVARQVAANLEQQGIAVVMTRQADVDLDLQPRVDIAEQVNASVFVSIHANAISMSRPDINGLETYYFDSGLSLAQSIHQAVLETTGTRDRGVRKARFFVLRRTSMPSVLVETGFVTGSEDVANFNNPAYRSRLAQGIALGIARYLRGG
ncbi:MAG: N-acetylmuramoyl-L-alanine amidase [Synechococcales bacterium]|nr:N-acetylmuramoyl-L-alanine amidase [Synechococcales bacterium]